MAGRSRLLLPAFFGKYMIKFTLDTNCMIDLAEERDNAVYVRKLVQAHDVGLAHVAIVGISASERQQDKDQPYLTDFGAFQERLAALGLDRLEIIPPTAVWDVTFWDCCTFITDEQIAREDEIHATMFPNAKSEWADFAADNSISAENLDHPLFWKWRNRLCDQKIFATHESFGRDILVTSNMKDFGRLLGNPLFPNAKILRPSEAAALIED